MTLSLEDVKDRTAKFLSEKWGCQVNVDEIEKVFGGASRETYRLRACWHESGHEQARRMILRRDPVTSLIDTERELEYSAYANIYPTDIPVPEPIFLENDPAWLGQPFSLMAAIEGCTTDTNELDDGLRQKIGQQKWSLMGSLAAKDPIALGFDAVVDVPDLAECAGRELAYWEQVIISDEIHPQPVARAAIRWLKANMPPPAQKLSVVHGDFRSGNFLFDANGDIKGILDWEMCHLGDPLEDLAWSLDPLWSWGDPAHAGRLLPADEAIRLWEESSGLKVDRQVFQWWRVFASVKALAIWVSSSEDFHNGESKETILAMAGWVMEDRQNRILLDYLSPSSRNEFGGRVS